MRPERRRRPAASAVPLTMPPPAMTVLPMATEPATPLPSPSPTPPPPTAAPSPSATPDNQIALGLSAAGRPLLAERVGRGALKVVLVGWDSPFPAAVLADYQANPASVPADVSLWVLPDVGLQGSDGALLDRNADTRFTRCPANIWTPDPADAAVGSGGAYPFSAPQSQALRAFLADAWLVLFYETGADLAQVTADSCREARATEALVSLLSARGRYALVPDATASGNWVDYLSSQGIASARVSLPADAPFDRDRAALAAVLAQPDDLLGAEASSAGGVLNWIDADNAGEWRLSQRNLVHPLAVDRLGDTFYLIDSGRVVALAADGAQAPRPILAADDSVAGVQVLEPLDLAASAGDLLVLGRGGDVYRFDPIAEAWSLERYVRGIGDTSSHYYLGLAAGAQSGSSRKAATARSPALRPIRPRPPGVFPKAAWLTWPLPERRSIFSWPRATRRTASWSGLSWTAPTPAPIAPSGRA